MLSFGIASEGGWLVLMAILTVFTLALALLAIHLKKSWLLFSLRQVIGLVVVGTFFFLGYIGFSNAQVLSNQSDISRSEMAFTPSLSDIEGDTASIHSDSTVPTTTMGDTVKEYQRNDLNNCQTIDDYQEATRSTAKEMNLLSLAAYAFGFVVFVCLLSYAGSELFSYHKARQVVEKSAVASPALLRMTGTD